MNTYKHLNEETVSTPITIVKVYKDISYKNLRKGIKKYKKNVLNKYSFDNSCDCQSIYF